MSKIVYVLLLVIDRQLNYAVGLTKKKGPPYLHGKLTFPGGRLEEGESLHEAASREMLEETGVHIPFLDWTLFETVNGPDYTLHKLVAASSKVLHARTQEEEPVWQLKVDFHLAQAACQPDQYVPDFIPTLKGALKALQEQEAGKKASEPIA